MSIANKMFYLYRNGGTLLNLRSTTPLNCWDDISTSSLYITVTLIYTYTYIYFYSNTFGNWKFSLSFLWPLSICLADRKDVKGRLNTLCIVRNVKPEYCLHI